MTLVYIIKKGLSDEMHAAGCFCFTNMTYFVAPEILRNFLSAMLSTSLFIEQLPNLHHHDEFSSPQNLTSSNILITGGIFSRAF